jgi:DNA-binding transcriptional LysR family regulator
MLDLHRLQLLLRFSRSGSIAATAAAAGYTASAVSQHLSALERETGVALLDRTARSATLTEAGHRLAAHAARIVEQVERAEADLAGGLPEPAGHLVVSSVATAAIAFAPALADLQRRHRAITVTLRQAGTQAAVADLRARDSDIAVIDEWEGLGSTRAADLVHEDLVEDELVLVVPRDHHLARGDGAVDLSAVDRAALIAAPRGDPSRDLLDRALRRQDVRPASIWEFQGLATIAALVVRGAGVAVLPRLAVTEELRGSLAVRALPDLPPRRILAATRQVSRQHPAVQTTLQALRAHGRAASAPRRPRTVDRSGLRGAGTSLD